MPKNNRKEIQKKINITTKYAKNLRDIIVAAITEWESTIVLQLLKEKLSNEEIVAIKETILKEAYDRLVWRTLLKTERYNTPYHNKKLDELRVEHPDLIVIKGLSTFVSWPFFNMEDVRAGLNPDIEPLFSSEQLEHIWKKNSESPSKTPRGDLLKGQSPS
jgi:hypothetical protein